MSRRHTYCFTLVLFSLCAFHELFAQKQQQKVPQKTRILFLLDGSGSMLAKWEGRPRINTAKRLLSDMVDSLSTNANLELALRVYGHLYPKEKQNCQDTRLEIPFQPKNHNAIIQKLESIKPKGTTPIAYSLEKAVNDFPTSSGYRNIIIIITDGVESCDGDPCEVSLKLQKKNIFLKPFIIGLGGGPTLKGQFSCLGKYFDGSNVKKFRQALNKAIEQTLGKTTVSVELLDAKSRPTVTNVNITFVNNFTQVAAYEFVHYRDQSGRPDSVEVDGVLNYDLIVNTTPPIVQRNAAIIPGRHNTLRIKAPQGRLTFKQSGSQTYPNEVQVIVKNRKTGETINIQQVGDIKKYLTGIYDVEVTTLPRKLFEKVNIEQKQNKTLTLPPPGLLNVKMLAQGYGSIYEVKNDGSQQWVYTLQENTNQERVALQPGNYKIVFRTKNANGSKFTAIKSTTVKSGSSNTINLFN